MKTRPMKMNVIKILMCATCIATFFAVATSSDQPIQEKSLRSHTDTKNSNLEEETIGWTIINEEVDTVAPMIILHLQKLGIEHLQLPDMKESICIKPLFITYEAGLYLTNGIVYNLSGIYRHGNAFMTYQGKSFLSRFYIIIKNLQFEYNFMLKVMAAEVLGRVIGSLENTIIYAELSVNLVNFKLKLNDFRIIGFSNIQTELDQAQPIKQLTGIILSPITSLFKNRITTSIADGLKEQMQTVMDDFNNEDPLQLREFTNKLVSAITGNVTSGSNLK
ncbi:uncharacterized protein LOC119560018 [Drosophila subpulchrella]|uniref:uncharacterized protein LOC119560018 n=1 Tax=Drosophila subpulchrella TaxID=1486046 RepID=UPI0018A19C3D|nr:uncharacterized protein LOC119560018 [Drosophila subpulchrella]XP_037729235.1 uncharacterized protein LOC119560018 [Drosophila subpulchrella]